MSPMTEGRKGTSTTLGFHDRVVQGLTTRDPRTSDQPPDGNWMGGGVVGTRCRRAEEAGRFTVSGALS